MHNLHGWFQNWLCLLVFTALLLPAPTMAQVEEKSPEGVRQEIEELKKRVEELEEKEATADLPLLERLELGLLLEFGGVWKDVEFSNGSSEDKSSFAMTTVELSMGVQLADWVAGQAVFLYEDPTFDEETSVDMDVATITVGNTQQWPFSLTGGAFCVPFGALFTHFPDDPLIDVPLPLLLGEAREKALLAGFTHKGLSLSAYAFNGDLDKEGNDDRIESYGFDARYDWAAAEEGGLAFTVGASYLSNIADSDGVTDALDVDELQDYVGGFDAYLHAEYVGFFFLAEYMSATDKFDPGELAAEGGGGAEPAVWNIEAGYNWNWWRNLEICLKYAGSDEAGQLGFPESRYGISFNQDLHEGLVLSLGYLHDKFEDNDADSRDERDTVFGQLLLEFY